MAGKQIYLTGFMGAGKSMVAEYLHRLYGFKSIEMDAAIEKKEKMKISEIFRKKGEAYFRDLETSLLRELSEEGNVVVSCGGGTVMRLENVRIMKENGEVILLKASPKTIYDRVRDNHDRPLLEGNMNQEYIAQLMEARRPAYEAAADVVIPTDEKSGEEICKEILHEWNIGNTDK